MKRGYHARHLCVGLVQAFTFNSVQAYGQVSRWHVCHLAFHSDEAVWAVTGYALEQRSEHRVNVKSGLLYLPPLSYNSGKNLLTLCRVKQQS